MNTLSQAKHALSLFANPLATKSQRHHNARAWLRSVQLLGDDWILATPITEKKAWNGWGQ